MLSQETKKGKEKCVTKAVREYGGNLGVTHVSSKVMQVFKVTKAETQFPIFETPDAAIKEFKS